MRQSKLTGAISLVVAQAIVLLFGYAAHLWIGRILGPAPYGVYGVVLSIQSIIGLLLTLGVPIAVSRFVAQDTAHARSTLQQAIRLQISIALTIGLFTVLIAHPIAAILGDPGLTRLIRFVALVIVLQAAYPVFVQFLSGLHFFNRQAALTAVYASAKLIGTLALIYYWQVYGAFAGFAIGGIVAGILGWWWTRRAGGTASRRLPLKTFLQFAGTYVLILIGLQVLISLDLFMVKALLGSDVQAGYYNAAVTLARIPYLLLQGLTFVLLPSVSALTKPGADRTRAKTFIASVVRYLVILITPGALLAAATSRSLITLFYSQQYLPAAGALTLLMLGLSAIAFFLLLVNIAAGAGRAKAGLALTVLMIAVSAGTGAFLIPRFGIFGAALQTTIAGAVGCLYLAVYTHRTFAIPVPYRTLINSGIASAIAVAPTYIWKADGLLLPMQYLLLGGVYIAALILLQEVSPADRKRIAGIHPILSRLAPADS